MICLVNTKKGVCAIMALQLLKLSLSHWDRHKFTALIPVDGVVCIIRDSMTDSKSDR